MALFDQRESLGFVAAQLARLVAGRLRDGLAPLGLQPAQVAALIEIGRDEGLTQKTLVERLEVEQPGVARTLNGLEAEGWITRQSKTGRAQGLYLTERARMVLPRAAAVTAEVNAQALAELSRTERDQLLDQLGSLAATIKQAG